MRRPAEGQDPAAGRCSIFIESCSTSVAAASDTVDQYKRTGQLKVGVAAIRLAV
jgi:hypothetical protein